MGKLKSYDELKSLAKKVQSEDKAINVPLIKVSMATCSIAAGGKNTMDAIINKLKDENIKDYKIIKTGCMGFCFAEPTVEVTLPGKAPVVFGDVDTIKGEAIVSKYIKSGEMLDGVIPINYKTIAE